MASMCSVFCLLPKQGLLIDLGPLYKYLVDDRGYDADGEHIIIEGIPVQFLPPNTKLMEEALEKSVDIQIERGPTRVIGYEYLLAIMVQTGRNKDKARIVIALDSKKPDTETLHEILRKHVLLDKWNKITA